MSKVADLTRETQAMSRSMGLNFNFRQCKRIVLNAIRRMEREEDRLFGLRFETSDDYKIFSYSDPTGETAVRNLIRHMLTSA